MADPNLPLAPDLPPIETHRSGQYEFNDEQNRQISGLVDAMRVCAGLMQLMGLAFVVLCVMAVLAARQSGGYGPSVGLGAGRSCACPSASGPEAQPHRSAESSRPRTRISGT